jgi:soluble lytic murein transglycosylase
VPALRFCRLVVFALCCVGPVQASVEKDFLAAREAYSKGRIDTFLRQADRFPDRHPLKVYLDYWRLKSHATSTNALLAFADANADTPLSERARQDVARFHGRNANWPAYREVAARLARQDNELKCLTLHARLDQNEPAAATDALTMWRTDQDLPSSCDPLFNRLAERGQLTADNRLDRLRLALEAGNLKLARALLASGPDQGRAALNRLTRAQQKPAEALQSSATSETEREILLYALAQMAKSDPAGAATHWQNLTNSLPEATVQHGWGVLAMAAARQHRPEATGWFLRAPLNQLSETQRLWRIRAKLRAGRWLDVYQGILSLPATTQNEAVWR